MWLKSAEPLASCSLWTLGAVNSGSKVRFRSNPFDSLIGCVLFPRSYRSDRSEQKFAVLFTAQTNPIKILRVLFLLSDLSDRSDFVRSKATERLDKPAHFRLFKFSLPIATWQTIREFLLIYVYTVQFSGVLIEITFNWPTITTVCLFTFIRPNGQQQQHHRYLHRHY